MCKWLSEQGGSTASRWHSLRWGQHRRWSKPGSAREGGRQRVRPAVVFSMRHGLWQHHCGRLHGLLHRPCHPQGGRCRRQGSAPLLSRGRRRACLCTRWCHASRRHRGARIVVKEAGRRSGAWSHGGSRSVSSRRIGMPPLPMGTHQRVEHPEMQGVSRAPRAVAGK